METDKLVHWLLNGLALDGDRTAEHVGYRSHAAFSHAFKKIIGEQPGAYRRSHRAAGPSGEMAQRN